MSEETEFALWLKQCALDGKKKLGLTQEQIAYLLIEEARRHLLAVVLGKLKQE